MKAWLVAALLYAGGVTVWNLMLMSLLDIAKGDVRRLAVKLHPSNKPPTLTILEQRHPGSAS